MRIANVITHTTARIYRCLAVVSGADLPHVIGDRRAGDVEQIWADAFKAENKLKWTCQYNMEDIMDTVWKWQQVLRQGSPVKLLIMND